ncbi:MAG: methylmalonyl-CoA mutase, partial [Alphaproteobacteria bacterium]
MDDFRPVPLAEGFARPSEEDWRALVERALKGAPFERLVSRSDDGIEIRPLYTRRDIAIEQDPSGFPGLSPHLRGAKADERPFALMQRVDHPDPEVARRQALADLEGGAHGLVLVIDDGRPIETGGEGVVLGIAPGGGTDTEGRLGELLDGVRLDLAPVALEAGAAGSEVARAFLRLLKKGEQPVERSAGGGVIHDLGFDPLAETARQGYAQAAAERAVAEALDFLDIGGGRAAPVRLLRLSGRVWHDAGASEAQELAILLANGVFWLRRLEALGIAPERSAALIGFHLMADADLTFTIARIRVMRALWRRLLSACGVAGVERHEPHILAETAPRMFTRYDPWVNILRATIAVQGAMLGGARAISVRHHLDALAPGDDLARRISRNIAIICSEESHLRQVIDIAGGSFAIETLTRELAGRAWELFRRIEGEGGLDAALSAGSIHETLDAMAERRRRLVATRARPITGVSEFPDLKEELPAGLPADRAALRAEREQERFGLPDSHGGGKQKVAARP